MGVGSFRHDLFFRFRTVWVLDLSTWTLLVGFMTSEERRNKEKMKKVTKNRYTVRSSSELKIILRVSSDNFYLEKVELLFKKQLWRSDRLCKFPF